MTTYDVIVVGAGIQGLVVAKECADQGRSVLVVEKSRAGEGTTGNSFGIVHGGLRYLQSLNIRRWRRSRRDQAWFMTAFPDLVEPLTCVMPLYKGTFRSPLAFKTAFRLEQMLSAIFREPAHLAAGRILSRDETLTICNSIVPDDLVGAAQWHEIALRDSAAVVNLLKQRLMRAGVEFAEGYEVTGFTQLDQRTSGVIAKSSDRTPVYLAADKVILCVGPWSEALSELAGTRNPNLACESLAFNLLLDIEPAFAQGLALSPKAGAGRSYFVRPYRGKMLAGTFYAAVSEGDPQVEAADIAAFKTELQKCLPSLDIMSAPVSQIFAGRLPALSPDRLATEDQIVDHGARGGIEGVFTVLGVKLTTAKSLAVRAVNAVWPQAVQAPETPPRRNLPALR